jgi:SAM-dependent methyltransferase
MLSASEWHKRFLLQSNWTANIREYLFAKAKFQPSDFILEVGCGTGAILEKIQGVDHIHGVDIDFRRLEFTKNIYPKFELICGDGHSLPFNDNVFNVLISHFLLLWVTDPREVIKEMIRVGKPGGKVLFLAEPDHVGRIDYPDELIKLGKEQTISLISQGADVEMGRKLASLLVEAGLSKIETGLLGGQWNSRFSQEEWEMEWQVLESDIIDIIQEGELLELRNLDLQASKNGSRVLFVPTFYGFGIIP